MQRAVDRLGVRYTIFERRGGVASPEIEWFGEVRVDVDDVQTGKNAVAYRAWSGDGHGCSP